MKFLCLAYGSEADWNALTKARQDELLAADDVLRRRGDFVTALADAVTTVSARGGALAASPGPFAASSVPLAGFAIIEAADVDEVVRLVSDTPCARANGAIEIRPLMTLDAG